ncbi:MAG: hypothetical protein ACYCO0_04260 [Candidatus Micrarchaeaceae archaeon]
MNANKPHRDPFHYTYDSSGKMQDIVQRFLDGSALDEKETHYIRWYIWQFVDAYVDNEDLGNRINSMDQHAIRRYVEGIKSNYGINPF